MMWSDIFTTSTFVVEFLLFHSLEKNKASNIGNNKLIFCEKDQIFYYSDHTYNCWTGRGWSHIFSLTIMTKSKGHQVKASKSTKTFITVAEF